MKYRKAFMMQVQKDALTSAASFSCLQLVRHFQEEHFKRCSCVLFTKLLTPIAAPNTLNLERVFSLFPFCRGHYCFLGQSYLFSMLDPSFQNCDLHLRRAMVGMGWRFQLVVIAQTVLHLDEVNLKKRTNSSPSWWDDPSMHRFSEGGQQDNTSLGKW